MPGASNYTFLARLDPPGAPPEGSPGGAPPGSRGAAGDRSGDGSPEGGPLVVYKPRRGEAPLWDFPSGTLCQREVAAFLVSRAGGFDVVPPTVLRDGPAGPGSVQEFIEHDFDCTAFDLFEGHAADLRCIALFDLVVNNADRKAGHVFPDAAGHIWAIDHGICFHVEPKLRTVLWDFAELPITGEEQACLSRLEVALSGELGSILDGLLDREELAALRYRLAAIKEAAVFPVPGPAWGPSRAFPWPPI